MASRNVKDLHPALEHAYMKALKIYTDIHPDQPQPFLTCTYRSNLEQGALYAQGRMEHAHVNELRRKAGMLEIGKTEARRKVTNAKPGSSYHNKYPAQAFDIAFINSNKKLDWSPHLFEKFWDIINKIDSRLRWGGNWRTLSDKPHYQIEL